jgi:hypothetical protein
MLQRPVLAGDHRADGVGVLGVDSNDIAGCAGASGKW